jgi:hypothetical protein
VGDLSSCRIPNCSAVNIADDHRCSATGGLGEFGETRGEESVQVGGVRNEDGLVRGDAGVADRERGVLTIYDNLLNIQYAPPASLPVSTKVSMLT